MIHYIYKITNKINNKSYIGQTNDIEERWDAHRKCARSKDTKRQYPVHRAIIKHGLDNFTWEIIDKIEINSKEEIIKIDDLEASYIRSLNTLAPDGYNLVIGGTNHFIRQETKDKISATLKAIAPLIKKRGRDSHMYGTTWKPGRKELMLKALSGENAGMAKLTAKEVVEIYEMYLNNEKIYPAEIAVKFNVNINTVRNILKRKSWKKETYHLPDIILQERAVGEKCKNAKFSDLEIYNLLLDYFYNARGHMQQIAFNKKYKGKIGKTFISRIKNGISRKNIARLFYIYDTNGKFIKERESPLLFEDRKTEYYGSKIEPYLSNKKPLEDQEMAYLG